ncbi:MAG: tRNA pseudouridine(38-40) synthase TruA [Deltaproteobacteria bacterium]|nr:tRNA pseudouridine(38-40) synthase TruA [Deltaproteobacteria bacterium]
MRNIRLMIAYDGRAYHGWQVQPATITIQGTIEEVLARLTQAPCRLFVAGRTDAGVHAEGQIANFRTESPLSCLRLQLGLNGLLPDDIAILAVDEVAPDFNSRYGNGGKHYRYTIFNQRVPSLRYEGRSWRLWRELTLEPMVRAGQKLVGDHDFAAFRAANCECETTTRTMYRCTLTTAPPLIQIDITGTAFLKNMVRIIVGTLVGIGRGKLAEGAVEEMLQSGDRTLGGPTAPAQGLTLMRVFPAAESLEPGKGGSNTEDAS